MQLSELIRQSRKKKGMTQAQLADALHVTPEAISKIESGKRDIGLGYVPILCETLEIDRKVFYHSIFMSDE